MGSEKPFIPPSTFRPSLHTRVFPTRRYGLLESLPSFLLAARKTGENEYKDNPMAELSYFCINHRI